jgi:hypothetical protein
MDFLFELRPERVSKMARQIDVAVPQGLNRLRKKSKFRDSERRLSLRG